MLRDIAPLGDTKGRMAKASMWSSVCKGHRNPGQRDTGLIHGWSMWQIPMVNSGSWWLMVVNGGG
jgi:hypothetical protein